MNSLNFDFASDFATKVSLPSKQLYSEVGSSLAEIWGDTKSAASDVHQKIAEVSVEFYDAPLVTASRWKEELTVKSNDMYTVVNSEIIPKIQSDYQNLASDLATYGMRTQESLQVFIDNPTQITAESFNQVSQALQVYFKQFSQVSSEWLNELGSQSGQIVNLLLEQPMSTLEAVYYDSLSVLLNSYFVLVSSMLQGLS